MRVSKVPEDFSSANSRMVMTGAEKSRISQRDSEAEKNFGDRHQRRHALQLVQQVDEAQAHQEDRPGDDDIADPRIRRSAASSRRVNVK